MTLSVLTALAEIVQVLRLENARLRFIQHPVGVNWRQRHTTLPDRITHIADGLHQEKPVRQHDLSGEEFLERAGGLLFPPCNPDVISIISKVETFGETFHLPLMNLHPEEPLEEDKLLELVNVITEEMPGYLFFTGRYYHFYGVSLLTDAQWRRFLAAWLMPTVLVSPRYIGHSLYRNYAALRLTASEPHKPTLPYLMTTVNM
jgi:hypothetical protein